MFRQGDVLVIPIKSVPTTAQRSSEARVILAYGEVTGHAHEVITADPAVALPAALLMTDPTTNEVYLLVEGPCQLTHQEHGTIALAPGAYKVVRQREYSPEAIRQVAD